MKNILIRTVAIHGSSGTLTCMFGEKGNDILVFSRLQRTASRFLSNASLAHIQLFGCWKDILNFPVNTVFLFYKTVILSL